MRGWSYQRPKPMGVIFKGVLRFIEGQRKIRRGRNRGDRSVMSRGNLPLDNSFAQEYVSIVGSLHSQVNLAA